MRFADRPAGDALDVAFDPPAIENAEAWHAVQRCFHAACARGFERILRRVQPQISAGGEHAAEVQVVVVQKNNGDCFLKGFLRFKNLFDDSLPPPSRGWALPA